MAQSKADSFMGLAKVNEDLQALLELVKEMPKSIQQEVVRRLFRIGRLLVSQERVMKENTEAIETAQVDAAYLVFDIEATRREKRVWKQYAEELEGCLRFYEEEDDE